MSSEQHSGNRPPPRRASNSAGNSSPRRSAGPVIEVVKVVLGGAAGIAIAVVILWYGFDRDPLGLFTAETASSDDSSPLEATTVAQQGSPQPNVVVKVEPASAAVASPPAAGQNAASPPQAQERTVAVAVVEQPAKKPAVADSPTTAPAPGAPQPGAADSGGVTSAASASSSTTVASVAPADGQTSVAEAAVPVIPATSDSRREPPSAADQEENQKKIREIFAGEYRSAQSAEAKANLSLLLQREANKLQDPAARFMLLREAYLVGLGAGRLDLAAEMVRTMDDEFRIDLDRVRLHMVSNLGEAARSMEDRLILSEAALEFARQAMEKPRPDLAAALAEVAESLALRSRDAALRRMARDLADSARAMDRARQAVQPLMERLAKNPEDAEANSLYGKYVCTVEGDWAKGLPMLAKGNDEQLRRAAQRDLESPIQPDDQIELADLWAAIADADPALQNFYARAATWYKETQPHDGL